MANFFQVIFQNMQRKKLSRFDNSDTNDKIQYLGYNGVFKKNLNMNMILVVK